MTILEWLCHKETCREIIQAMTGQQLFLAWLRWNGYSVGEVATMLGLSNKAVFEHQDEARRRIRFEVPETASVLEGVGPPHRCCFCGEYVTRGSTYCCRCAGIIRQSGSFF